MKYERQHVGGFKDQYGGPIEEGPHHDRLTINVRVVFAFALVLLVVLGLVFGSMVLLYKNLTVHVVEGISADSPLPVREPERPPGLIVAPGQDLRQLRQEERRLLERYGWIDRDRVARVPVERAMELIVDEGVPFEPAADDEQAEQPQDEPPDNEPDPERRNEANDVEL